MTLSIDPATRSALDPYGFDLPLLESFVQRAGAPSANAVTGILKPPQADDVTRLPALGTPERAKLTKAGLAAIAKGHVGAVVLAGGMATRFGGVVKAVVPVLGDRTFLELKHDDIARISRRAGGRSVPTFVMSSFTTHDRIKQHIDEKCLTMNGRPSIEVFPQFVSLRLTPKGTLFHESTGALSPYAPGHGDLTFALRRSGLLSRFREAGGRMLLMSNVDNLGATLDPALIGLHLEMNAELTAEVVRKENDKGGAPARLDGTLQIIEGFRFPPTFDQDSINVFNTNTFVLDAEAIDRAFDLPFYRVEKQVDGKPAVQFERLVGELTAFVRSRFVEVEREGDDGRFLPAKDPEELAKRLPNIERVVTRAIPK